MIPVENLVNSGEVLTSQKLEDNPEPSQTSKYVLEGATTIPTVIGSTLETIASGSARHL